MTLTKIIAIGRFRSQSLLIETENELRNRELDASDDTAVDIKFTTYLPNISNAQMMYGRETVLTMVKDEQPELILVTASERNTNNLIPILKIEGFSSSIWFTMSIFVSNTEEANFDQNTSFYLLRQYLRFAQVAIDIPRENRPSNALMYTTEKLSKSNSFTTKTSLPHFEEAVNGKRAITECHKSTKLQFNNMFSLVGQILLFILMNWKPNVSPFLIAHLEKCMHWGISFQDAFTFLENMDDGALEFQFVLTTIRLIICELSKDQWKKDKYMMKVKDTVTKMNENSTWESMLSICNRKGRYTKNAFMNNLDNSQIQFQTYPLLHFIGNMKKINGKNQFEEGARELNTGYHGSCYRDSHNPLNPSQASNISPVTLAAGSLRCSSPELYLSKNEDRCMLTVPNGVLSDGNALRLSANVLENLNVYRNPAVYFHQSTATVRIFSNFFTFRNGVEYGDTEMLQHSIDFNRRTCFHGMRGVIIYEELGAFIRFGGLFRKDHEFCRTRILQETHDSVVYLCDAVSEKLRRFEFVMKRVLSSQFDLSCLREEIRVRSSIQRLSCLLGVLHDMEYTYLLYEYPSGGSIGEALQLPIGMRLEPRNITSLLKEITTVVKEMHQRGLYISDFQGFGIGFRHENDCSSFVLLDYPIEHTALENGAVQIRDELFGFRPPEYFIPQTKINKELQDVWIVGCVWYFLLTKKTIDDTLDVRMYKRQCFPNEDLIFKLNEIPELIKDELERAYVDGFQRELIDLIKMALQVSPTRRPSMDQLCALVQTDICA